ncbi:S-layer homology domain-containing protein [Helicovermis profundi]
MNRKVYFKNSDKGVISMEKHIKRIISINLVFIALIIMSFASFGEIAGSYGGITGDPQLKVGVFEYEEVTFITGEPVILKGTVTIPPVDKSPLSYNMSYTYSAQNTEKKIVLSRKITYLVTKTIDKANNQTITKIDMTKFDENYSVGSDTFSLGSFLFDKSKITDNTPAVDYFSGNVYSKRIFYKNGDAISNKGKFTIETNTKSLVGYKHKWGNQETEILNEKLEYEYLNPNYDSTNASSSKYLKWTGNATLKMSSTKKVDFLLQGTDPQNISFRKNYIQTDSEINLLSYKCNLPTLVSGGSFNDLKRNSLENSIRKDITLDTTSKIVPKIKDIGGYWAENNIFLLASIGIYDVIPNYFMADLPISRIEFAKEIVRAITDDLNYLDDEAKLKQKLILLKRPTAVKPDNFDDIDLNSKDSFYTSYVKEKGIMHGMGNSGEFFKPYRSLTRAQAITIMVNALGLSDIAPKPPYKTKFKDDADIPLWSKDAIYIANEIGLVSGYQDETIRANGEITKGEASVLIKNFINHLKDNITSDYREKVMSRY